MTRKQFQIVKISQSIFLYKLNSVIKRTLKQFLFSHLKILGFSKKKRGEGPFLDPPTEKNVNNIN